MSSDQLPDHPNDMSQPALEQKPAETSDKQEVLKRVEGSLEDSVYVRAQFQHHSGPLPPPEIMAAYDRIVPGGAARIFASFEKQLDHRISIEKTVIDSNSFSQRMGAVSAMLVALLGIGGSLLLMDRGHDLSGLATVLLVIGGIVATFVTGKRAQNEELESKRRDEDDDEPEVP